MADRVLAAPRARGGPLIPMSLGDLSVRPARTRTKYAARERHTGPFRIADCAEFPLCSFNLWDKEDATIARALQNGDPFLGGHVSQFLVAQRNRIPGRTIDAQLAST